MILFVVIMYVLVSHIAIINGVDSHNPRKHLDNALSDVASMVEGMKRIVAIHFCDFAHVTSKLFDHIFRKFHRGRVLLVLSRLSG